MRNSIGPTKPIWRETRCVGCAPTAGADSTSTTPPLFRLTLIRRGPADFVLVWTFHHALLDGRSHRFVLEEAFAAYEAFRDGSYPSLLPVRPFPEHVEWLRQQDPAAAEQYWRGVLAGFETPTPLPVVATPRPPATPEPGEQVVVIPEDVTAGLKAFAAENGLTPTTLLHAAWAVLLARYSGETDVVFGGTRDRPSAGPRTSRPDRRPAHQHAAGSGPGHRGHGRARPARRPADAMAGRPRLRLSPPRSTCRPGPACRRHAALRDDRRRRELRPDRIAASPRRAVGEANGRTARGCRTTRWR